MLTRIEFQKLEAAAAGNPKMGAKQVLIQIVFNPFSALNNY